MFSQILSKYMYTSEASDNSPASKWGIRIHTSSDLPIQHNRIHHAGRAMMRSGVTTNQDTCGELDSVASWDWGTGLAN